MAHLCSALSGDVCLATVYLLDELVADAQSGMPEVGLMVEFCVKRLTAKPPIVKQKVAQYRTVTQGKQPLRCRSLQPGQHAVLYRRVQQH